MSLPSISPCLCGPLYPSVAVIPPSFYLQGRLHPSFLFLSPDLSPLISDPLPGSLPCGFASLHLPAPLPRPPASPGARPTTRACGSSLSGPARSSAGPLCSQLPPPPLPPPPHRPPGPAFPSSSQARQAGPSLQPTMRKNAETPRWTTPDDTTAGTIKETPPRRLPPPHPPSPRPCQGPTRQEPIPDPTLIPSLIQDRSWTG